jgi:hypothetical protein
MFRLGRIPRARVRSARWSQDTAPATRSSIRAKLRHLPVLAVGIALLLALLPASAGAATCTTTVSSTSAVVSAVSAAQPGATVCLANGSYGALTLNANKAAPGVMVQAANPGQATVNGVDLSGAGLGVSQFMITAASSTQGSGVVVRQGSSRMVVDHNDISIANDDFGVFLYGDNGAISDVTIQGNRFHGVTVGDAIRVHNFRNVQVLDNEFQDVNEDGNHNDVLQSVHGGQNLTFSGNYMHDNNNGQGFFVKDGAVNGITVTDNLDLRDPGSRGRPFSWLESSNITVSRNVVWNDDNTICSCGSNTGGTISLNVSSRAIEIASGDHPTLSGNVVGGNPDFVDPAHDDFRLRDGSAGVTWRPADKVFGPGGTSTPPPPDTTPPDTTITTGPSDPTSSTSASFGFASSESNSTYECKLDAGAFAACTSPKSYTGLSTGSHTFSVRATDSSGNTDASPASQTWTINPPADTTPPNTTITSGPSGPTNDATPAFGFTSSESGSAFACRVDSAAYAACTSPWTTPALADGPHAFSVRATDAAGNTDASPATRSFTVDTTAPQTTITSSPPALSLSNSGSVTFTVNESGAISECRLDGGAWTACTSPYRVSGVSIGSHEVDVRSTDAAGNVESPGASATWTVVLPVDTPLGTTTPASATTPAGPTVTLTAPVANSTVGRTIRFSATAASASGVRRVEFWVDNRRVASDTRAPYAGRAELSWLHSGMHTITARTFDKTGQAASSAALVRVVRRHGNLRAVALNLATRSALVATAAAGPDATRLAGQAPKQRMLRVTLSRCSDSKGAVAESARLRADSQGRVDGMRSTAGLCVLRLALMS